MNHYCFITTACSCYLLIGATFSVAKDKGCDYGEEYAKARIVLDGEREFQDWKKKPGEYHIPKEPSFDSLSTMEECVHSYLSGGNLSGIRGAFLMAYIAVSVPHRSGEVLGSYGDPLFDLLKGLGDQRFALCLRKMRPEVQSAVFYIMFINQWPQPGQDRDWDKRMGAKWSNTFKLSTEVKRLKWPHDYEK